MYKYLLDKEGWPLDRKGVHQLDDIILVRAKRSQQGQALVEVLRREGVPRPEQAILCLETDEDGGQLRLGENLEGLSKHSMVFARAHGGRVIQIQNPASSVILV
jgi:hypothetical protein